MNATRLATLYLVLAILGAALPLLVFFGWIGGQPPLTEGLTASFFANRAASAAVVDVLWASLVFWVWVAVDCQRRGTGFAWWVVPINLTLGLCAALPLYLWRVERQHEAH